MFRHDMSEFRGGAWPGRAVRVLSSFFVVRGARRSGIGLRAVRKIVARHPGRWEVGLFPLAVGLVQASQQCTGS
jgi:hypothetical protein